VDKPLRKEVTITLTLEEKVIRAAFEAVIEDVHETAVAHGWHEQPTPLPVKLALIHSEVSEALEADRKHLGEDAVAEELADVVIRVMDTAAAHRLDLAGALFRKMDLNRQREYRHGGRKY
jgi:NTP pyrophosphatase (non-canonical NTP hydrolase)